MQILNNGFKNNKKQYILQTLIVTLIVFILLLVADSLSEMTVIASLGGSALTAFSFPSKINSKPRYMVGGYIIGIIAGITFHYCNAYLDISAGNIFGKPTYIFTCAFVVGITMFVMVVTNCAHPPAAGIAMSLVLDEHIWMTAFIAFISIIVISGAQQLLKKYLKDLM